MKSCRATTIVGALVIFELLTSQAMAKKPPAPPQCTGGIFGGQVCSHIIKGFLTDEQVQTIQRWTNENLEQTKNSKDAPKK